MFTGRHKYTHEDSIHLTQVTTDGYLMSVLQFAQAISHPLMTKSTKITIGHSNECQHFMHHSLCHTGSVPIEAATVRRAIGWHLHRLFTRGLYYFFVIAQGDKEEKCN